MQRLGTISTGVLCALFAFSSAHAISPGQVDDFQDMTAMNWAHGSAASPTPPSNAPDEGPGGAGDHALLNTSNGMMGAGSRMAMINESQWSGDFNAAGVNEISMMLRADPAGSPLDIRLGFQRDFADRALTDAFSLPNDGNWHNVTYDITPAALTVVQGLFTPEEIRDDVMQMRIFSTAALDWRGDEVAANLYVDNITAIPEPSLGAAGLIALLAVARRRKIG